MIMAPLGIIAAVSQAQSLAKNILRPITSSSAKSFDQVMKNEQYNKVKKLIGAQVNVENDNGITVTGTVEKVEMDNKGIILQVDGHKYRLSQLKEILGKQNNGVTV